MTSATAERTFSPLRRLKNFLQSNISQERLNHNACKTISNQENDQNIGVYIH